MGGTYSTEPSTEESTHGRNKTTCSSSEVCNQSNVEEKTPSESVNDKEVFPEEQPKVLLPEQVFIVDGPFGIYYTDSEEEADRFVSDNIDSDCVSFVLNGWMISKHIEKKETRKTITIYGEKTNSAFFGFGRSRDISQYSIYRVPRIIPPPCSHYDDSGPNKEEIINSEAECDKSDSDTVDEPGTVSDSHDYACSDDAEVPKLNHEVYSLVPAVTDMPESKASEWTLKLHKTFQNYEEAMDHVRVMNMVHSDLPKLLTNVTSKEEKDNIINKFCFGESHLGLQRYFLGMPCIDSIRENMRNTSVVVSC